MVSLSEAIRNFFLTTNGVNVFLESELSADEDKMTESVDLQQLISDIKKAGANEYSHVNEVVVGLKENKRFEFLPLTRCIEVYFFLFPAFSTTMAGFKCFVQPHQTDIQFVSPKTF